MTKPQLWVLEPNQYSYHIIFNFVDHAGRLLKTKTWQIHKEASEPSKIMLLQGNATFLGKIGKPELKVLAPNFLEVTTVVSAIHGDLYSTTVVGFDHPKVVAELMANYPLTMALVVENSGIHFTLHFTRPTS